MQRFSRALALLSMVSLFGCAMHTGKVGSASGKSLSAPAATVDADLGKPHLWRRINADCSVWRFWAPADHFDANILSGPAKDSDYHWFYTTICGGSADARDTSTYAPCGKGCTESLDVAPGRRDASKPHERR